MKIVTWNVNSLKVRLPQVLDWVQSEQPDVLCLQELKMVTESFPYEAFEALGYHCQVSGQKTYNGVATLSKHPQTDIEMDFPQLDDPQRRIMASTINGLRVLNVYVPNGQSVGSDKYQYKLNWLKHMRAYIEDSLKAYPRMVILGDFNIAPADEDVYDPRKWAGEILCSQDERSALQSILATGVVDAFRLVPQPAESFSWWDYRTMAFVGNRGLRIDLILVSPGLVPAVQKTWIDTAPRGLERPSDHTPVAMDLHPRRLVLGGMLSKQN